MTDLLAKLRRCGIDDAADEIESLRSRLAEADALIAKGLAVVHDFLPNIGRCVLQDYQRMNEFCSEAAARAAVSAVQPERCCVDYPRCDCNSPAEWPTREEAEKRAAELMTIGRDTLGENDDWLCFQRPAQPKVTP